MLHAHDLCRLNRRPIANKDDKAHEKTSSLTASINWCCDSAYRATAVRRVKLTLSFVYGGGDPEALQATLPCLSCSLSVEKTLCSSIAAGSVFGMCADDDPKYLNGYVWLGAVRRARTRSAVQAVCLRRSREKRKKLQGGGGGERELAANRAAACLRFVGVIANSDSVQIIESSCCLVRMYCISVWWWWWCLVRVDTKWHWDW